MLDGFGILFDSRGEKISSQNSLIEKTPRYIINRFQNPLFELF